MKLGKFVEDSRIDPTLKPIESAKPPGQVAIADDVRGTALEIILELCIPEKELAKTRSQI
jgi:hypothetical protein